MPEKPSGDGGKGNLETKEAEEELGPKKNLVEAARRKQEEKEGTSKKAERVKPRSRSPKNLRDGGS